MIGSVVEAFINDVRGARKGDPIVICGRVAEQSRYAKLAAALSDIRLLFTFGYERIIDIKFAASIAPDGRLISDPGRATSDAVVPCTQHVFRRTTAGQEVILLCNSSGTALAVESQIPDPELIAALRRELAKGNSKDEST